MICKTFKNQDALLLFKSKNIITSFRQKIKDHYIYFLILFKIQNKFIEIIE
ncbi:hypothetical protein [Inediibacterium massiliense]|uniref:hypothetical protein n=1 Tax=Inediibacterium massiliense TaxID=1658111 RepID=UPI0018FE3AC4|nr:hypothetical protein [Inediibacterium massiliense]